MSLFATILPFLKAGATSTIVRLTAQQITQLISNPSVEKTFQKAYDKALSLHEKGEKAPILSNSYSTDTLERIAEINRLDADDESKRFLRLLAIELLNNTKTSGLVISYKIDTVLKELADIKDELCTNENYNYFSFIESNVDVFIPRTLTKITSSDEIENKAVLSHEQYTSIIRDNKYVVFLANAGMGKSTLLRQIANYIARDEEYYPVFVSLNSYSADQPLNQYIEIRYPQIKKIQQSELVFILDGFDEIGVSSDVKKIHDFKEVYKESKILLSSRYSHYKNTLNGFQQYHLNDISIENINSYIHEKHPEIDLSSFLQEVKRVGIDKLIYNPFFLNIIIQYYIKNNDKLTNDKQSLIHGLLKERLTLDREHFKGINIDDELITIESNIRRLSLIMAVMNKRAIKEKELQYILPNSDELLKLKSAVPIRKDSEGIWSFEHAIFLENFASEALSCFDDFEELKELITYDNSQIIIDEWTNIIGYLVGILDVSSDIYKNLIKWLIEYNPTAIAKIETDKLTIEERDNLLLNIFQYHKEKTTWIERDVVYSLVGCEFSKAVIQVLYEEACNHLNHRRVRLNAIEFLEGLNLSNLNCDERKIFTQMLLAFIELSKDTDTEQLSNYINLITPLNLKDEGVIKELISILEHRKSSNTQMAICNLVSQWQQADIHIAYLQNVTKTAMANNSYVPNEDNVKQYTSIYDLESAIRNISKSTNLVILLKLYVNDHYNRSNSKDIFKTLLNQAEKLFDDILYGTVFDLFYKNGHWLLKDGSFTEFIQRMNLQKRILSDIIECKRKGEQEYCRIDILINDKEDVDICFEVYEEGVWELWRIDNLYRSFLNDKNHLAEYTLQQLAERYQHIPEVPRDDEKERIQRNQKAFDILFDIPCFKAECLKVFDDRGVDIICHEDVFEYNFREQDNSQTYEDFENSYNHAVEKRFRLEEDDDGNVRRKNIVSYFADKNIDFHQVTHIYDMLIEGDRNKELVITTYQLEYIEDWFKRYIDKTCFITALTYNGGNNYSFNKIAVILIRFLQRFNFDCPIKKLNEMTYIAWDSDKAVNIDNSFLSLAYLEERLGTEILSKQVIQNIQKEVKDRPIKTILENHLCYILEKKMKDYYSNVFNVLLSSDFDKYTIDRVLNTWFDSKENFNMLVDSLEHFTAYNQLTICEEAFKLGIYEQVSNKVEKLIYALDDGRYTRALTLMLKAKDLRGLEIYANDTRLKKSFPIGRWDARELLVFEDIEALPYYMQLLELSWEKSIGNNTDMKGLIIQALKRLAMISANNCKQVIESVNVFMLEHIDKLDDVVYLNDLLDDSNHFLLRSTYEVPNIKNAVSIVDKISSEWYVL